MTNKRQTDQRDFELPKIKHKTAAPRNAAAVGVQTGKVFSFGDALPPPQTDHDRRLREQLADADLIVRAEAALELGATYSPVAPKAAVGLLLSASMGPPMTAGRALLRLSRLVSTVSDNADDAKAECHARMHEYLDHAQSFTSGVGNSAGSLDPELLALRVDIATALVLTGSPDAGVATLVEVDRLLRSVGDPDRWEAPADEPLRHLAALVSLRLGQALTESDPYAADEPLQRAVVLGTGSLQATAALERGRLLEHHAGGIGPEIERQYMLAIDLDDPVASPLALIAMGDILWESGRPARAQALWKLAQAKGNGEIRHRANRRFIGEWQRDKKALKKPAFDKRLDFSRPLPGVQPSTDLGRVASGRAPDAPLDERIRPVVVVGAGTGGHYLLPALAHGYQVKGFVDDDPAAMSVRGLRVLGTTHELEAILKSHRDIVQVIFAIPTAPGSTRLRVLRAAHRCGVEVMSLPPMFELQHGRPLLAQLRPFQVDETYGDSPWAVDRDAHSRVRGRRVAIVGAGSVLGVELARRMVHGQPRHLLLIDEPPVPLMRLTDEIRNRLVDCDARIADYANHMEITEIFQDQQPPPEIVFYCGGVDYATGNALRPSHAARANVLTVSTVATVARASGCAELVVASVDRAGHRASWFDMTKALAERAALGTAAKTTTPEHDSLHIAHMADEFRVSVLRLPNLWAKDGAVVGRLSEQLRRGGPLRVRADARRRFAPGWDAAQTMLRLLEPGHRGGLFALVAGDVVEIRELAERLVLIQGLVPSRDIRIVGDSRPDTKASLMLWGVGETSDAAPVVGACSINQEPSLQVDLDRRLALLLKALQRQRPQDVQTAIRPLRPLSSAHTGGHTMAS